MLAPNSPVWAALPQNSVERRLVQALIQIANAGLKARMGRTKAVARLAARRGWGGLEFATGIPGTVGGAIVMNAGWHEHETSGLRFVPPGSAGDVAVEHRPELDLEVADLDRARGVQIGAAVESHR